MKHSITALLLCSLLAPGLSGQNVFPNKIEGCHLSHFCLDCGEPKASYDTAAFEHVLDAISARYDLRGINGKIAFQVLVDSFGAGCVLSHTDASGNKITGGITKYLAECKWNPALSHGKAVNASINLIIEIADTKIAGHIQRIDLKALNENMRNPGTPVIYNKKYKYANGSLDNYEITVWQRENSKLPGDMSQHSVVDSSDILWYATLNGLATFDGKDIVHIAEDNSPFKATEEVTTIGVDNKNNKWVFANQAIYKYDNKTWKRYDTDDIGIESANNILGNAYGEILFCSSQGLLILKNGESELLNEKTIKEFPPDKMVYFAYRDKRQRLWIGTFGGSLMIDSNGKVTAYNNTTTPINGTCISGAAEDGEGNIYFALYAYGNKERNRPQEGIAILSKDGTWTHFNDSNSGMPSDHVNALLYDKFEKLLWISTNESGLVRYDLHDGWENYHNGNSKIPSSYAYDLSQDSKGNIYLSTYNGMVRIRKK